MKSRNALLQALLCFVLIVSFVSPASVGGDTLSAGETWCFTFYNHLPAVYLYVDPVEIYYVDEDYDPPTPGGMDIDFNEIPELAGLAQLWYAPVPEQPICIQVTRDGDNIYASFDFTHETTGYDVSAELSGTIIGDAVGFEINYYLPNGLRNYSMPLSYSDCMSDWEGIVSYSLPAVLTVNYEGTIIGDTIQGAFEMTIGGQWACWRFHDMEYSCAWGITREELLFDGVLELTFSNLRLSGDFRVDLTPQVKFLDKDDIYREVVGATADGESKVIIQISPLPPDTKISDVSVQIASEGDGHLENDATVQGRVFTQTYTAPECFVRDKYPEDLTQGEREIVLGIRIKDTEIEHEPLYLSKAPVVLLHGLWSNATCWSELLYDLRQNGFKYALAYPYLDSVHFEENDRVVRNAVRASLNLARNDGFVAKKADVVCHSMGGLIAKLYGDETYVKSITTVGTPHYGSPLADVLCQLVGCGLTDEELNPIQYAVAWWMEKTGHPARNGAVEDLRENGGIHCPASQLNVDTHVIAGISPLTEESTILFVNLLSRIFKFCGLLEATDTALKLNQLIFGDERNDWVVSESSQEGGLEGQDDYVIWHCSEPTDNEIKGNILSILNGVEEGIQITALPTESGVVKEPWRRLPELQMNLSPGEVQIISPQEGEIFEPGDVVNVKVNVSDTNAVVLIVTSTSESMLIDHYPCEFQFIVPEDSIGGLSISAAARNATGFIGWDEVTINISVDSNLTELMTYPETSPIYLESGMSLPLAVYGLYGDGVKREITSSSCGTVYTSINSYVASISSEGLITAESAGNSTITIENSGIGKEIAVVVEGSPFSSCYIGAYLGCGSGDLSCESIFDFNQEMGKNHAIFMRYVDVADSGDPVHFAWAQEVKDNGAMPMFIYDPWGGLDAMNMTDVEYFASRCNELDTTVFIVFGHEMNGPWYPWGNDPDNYTSKFKEVAEIFHENAPNVEMCWVPNQNWGYPWGGNDYGNGYSEYYPEGIGTYGEYVDWVGLNFFEKDWDEDNLVPPDMFVANIRNGQDNADFYEMFAVGKNKPMLIEETGAFDPNKDPTAAGERNPLNEIEQAEFKNEWLEQVYDVSTLEDEFPRLNAICYFHVGKTETIDTQSHSFYDVTANYRIPKTPNFYKNLISDSYFIGAEVNNPPNTPSNPSPANHTTGVSINANLSWTGRDTDAGDTVTYDVYFSNSATPPLASDDQSGTMYDPGILAYNTTYYWEIVATDSHGVSSTGPLWDFTTQAPPNSPPNAPTNPSPVNHATGIPINADLSWSGGDLDAGDTVTYDVYFGTNSNKSANTEAHQVQTAIVAYMADHSLSTWNGDIGPTTTSGPEVYLLNPGLLQATYTAVNASLVSAVLIANSKWTGCYFTKGTWVCPCSTPPLVSNSQSGTTYDPKTLAYSITYYWQIVATDKHGASTTGPLWDFTTQAPPGPTVAWNLPWGVDEDPKAINIYTYEGVAVTLATVDATMPDGLLIWYYGGPGVGYKFYKKGWGTYNTLTTLVPNAGVIGIVPAASVWYIPQG